MKIFNVPMIVAPLVITFLFWTPFVRAQKAYSPPVNTHYPTNVYFGDTHVHTSLSTSDANLSGMNRMPPTVALRFARGEAVETLNGMTAQLSRPLDFLVVADHAENLGTAYSLQAQDPALLNTTVGKALYEKYQTSQQDRDSQEKNRSFRTALSAAPRQLPATYLQSVWETVADNADTYNQPGIFTAFAGYEWSSPGSVTGTFGNLHRVVLYRDNAETVTQLPPYSAYDSRNPEDLWAFMENYEKETGGEILAIPHNANVSDGEMFPPNQYDGTPLTTTWARTRSRWEPLYEVTQFKGDSETHPMNSPDDEFADFETWTTWAGKTTDPDEVECCPNWDPEEQPRKKKAEYARSALMTGLEQHADLGVNPFKFGMIGSTDAHTSFATADSDNFWGKFTVSNPSATRMFTRFHIASQTWQNPKQWETSASGYAAVWAHENTRESIFAAMKRKEVYATTGPRMTVRFFGGWDFTSDDAQRPDLAKIGYTKGVPMGGDLTNAPDDESPTFLIRATKDPDGANLDRVQIIKGWRDSNGDLHEKVHDVALADDRKVSRSGKVKPVGNTVDVDEPSYTNTIGDPELATVWSDPDFDPTEHAFYYLRILQIPTPRWTAYDKKFFDLKDLSQEIPLSLQERAYTSPIWYTP